MIIKLAKFFLLVVLGFIIMTALAVLSLRWMPVPTSAFMLAEHWAARLKGEPAELRYIWVDRAHIAKNLQVAVIASEDQKFLKHRGFDFDSMASAWKENRISARVRGASTISQQTAKNLFLWSGRSYFRKALEAYFTLLLELLWPKERILEVYLNIAEFGPGIYGAEAAAKQHFNKTAAQLTDLEASTLAAVLPSPKRFNAAKPSSYVQQRARAIREQMSRLERQYHHSL
jgi:monofunctional glycosyltransferase